MTYSVLNKAKIVGIACIALIILIVVLQNTQSVETKLLFFTVKMPNAALLFGALAIGFSLGVLAAGHVVSGLRWSIPSRQQVGDRKP